MHGLGVVLALVLPLHHFKFEESGEMDPELCFLACKPSLVSGFLFSVTHTSLFAETNCTMLHNVLLCIHTLPSVFGDNCQINT